MIPAYPPQNPVYPPTNPTMMPPNQFPQWNGPPPGQYPPGPAAPMVLLNSLCLEERNTGPLACQLHSVYGQPVVHWPWGGRGAGCFLNVLGNKGKVTSVHVYSGTEWVTLTFCVFEGLHGCPSHVQCPPRTIQWSGQGRDSNGEYGFLTDRHSADYDCAGI